MGGAFSAIADDATAALANPAGLGLISSIEIAVSGKRVDETLALATARSVATGSVADAVSARHDVLRRPRREHYERRVRRRRRSRSRAASSRRSPTPRTCASRATRAPRGYPYLELRDNRTPGIDAPRLPLRVPRVRLGEALEPAPRGVPRVPRHGEPADRRRRHAQPLDVRPRRRRRRPAPHREPHSRSPTSEKVRRSRWACGRVRHAGRFRRGRPRGPPLGREAHVRRRLPLDARLRGHARDRRRRAHGARGTGGSGRSGSASRATPPSASPRIPCPG